MKTRLISFALVPLIMLISSCDDKDESNEGKTIKNIGTQAGTEADDNQNNNLSDNNNNNTTNNNNNSGESNINDNINDNNSFQEEQVDLIDWPCTIFISDQGIPLSDLERLAKYHLEMINQDREYFQTESDQAENLTWDANLWRVAMCHAKDMCDREYVAHNNPDGVTPRERMVNALGDIFWRTGENIAFNYDSTVNAQSNWDILKNVMRKHNNGYMDECQCGDGCPSGKQSGHRGSNLDPRFTHVGIGEWYCEKNDYFYNAMSFASYDSSLDQNHPYCDNDFTADPPDPVSTVLPDDD